MTDLNEFQKAFLVTENACYRKPAALAKAFKETFDLEISRQLVECYDPTKVAGKDLSEQWRVLFNKARKAFLEDTEDIQFFHQPARLRALNDIALTAIDRGNTVEARAALEQIAKEAGGAYTNKRELSGPGAAPFRLQ